MGIEETVSPGEGALGQESSITTALLGSPSPRMQAPGHQRLTLHQELVDKAETHVHQLGPELSQGLWQLEEALRLLTVGAHQGFHGDWDVLQFGVFLACREGQVLTTVSQGPGRCQGSHLQQGPHDPQDHRKVEELSVFKPGHLFPFFLVICTSEVRILPKTRTLV